MASGDTMESRTYLTFTLDQEDFAVDVVGVREVLDYTDVTRVPRTPDFMKGIINLRGSVVPVVDMRLKFGLPETEKTVDTCIIVLEVEMDSEVTVIGAIADSVKEVFELDPADIEPPPRLGTPFEAEFISGMGKHNDEFIIILDVNKVFSTRELEMFRYSDEGAFNSTAQAQNMNDSKPAAPRNEVPEEGAETEESAADAEMAPDASEDSPRSSAAQKKPPKDKTVGKADRDPEKPEDAESEDE